MDALLKKLLLLERRKQALLAEILSSDFYTPTEDDVTIIQYLRPYGERRLVYAPLGAEYVKKSCGMIISAEALPTQQVAIYVRWEDESDEMESIEIANNTFGDDGPNEKLKQMINAKYEQRLSLGD